MAVAASPLLCNAGPILPDSNLEPGRPQGLHIPAVKPGGDKDDSKDKSDGLHDHDRPGHSHGTEDSDRGLKGHHGLPNEDHGRYSNHPWHDRSHCGDGPVHIHLGDHDGADPVPESASTAMLLGGTLIALLALARNQKPKAAQNLLPFPLGIKVLSTAP
jgi:hypothetical protein